MLIVYTLINCLIQGISSITESSFFIVFYIDKMIILRNRFKVCFSMSIKFSKNFSKTYNKRWTHFWEMQFQNYTTLYQRLWQQHKMDLQKDYGAYMILLLYCITWWRIWDDGEYGIWKGETERLCAKRSSPTGAPRRIYVGSTWILRRYIEDQVSPNFHVISSTFSM